MELTNELKARFFALYWGQNLVRDTDNVYHNHRVNPTVMHSLDGTEYLLLRPLSSITEEEALAAYKFCFPESHGADGVLIREFNKRLRQGRYEIVDHLRSKGFLVPFMGILPFQWVEWGVVKLVG